MRGLVRRVRDAALGGMAWLGAADAGLDGRGVAPVTRFDLRIRLVASFALVFGVVLYSQYAVTAMRDAVQSKVQVLEALTAAQAGV